MKTKIVKTTAKKTVDKSTTKSAKVSLKTKPVKKEKIVPTEKESDKKKVSLLKMWMAENEITQRGLSKLTGCSTNTINRLIKNGYASKSVEISVASQLNITKEQLTELLKFKKPTKI